MSMVLQSRNYTVVIQCLVMKDQTEGGNIPISVAATQSVCTRESNYFLIIESVPRRSVAIESAPAKVKHWNAPHAVEDLVS